MRRPHAASGQGPLLATTGESPRAPTKDPQEPKKTKFFFFLSPAPRTFSVTGSFHCFVFSFLISVTALFSYKSNTHQPTHLHTDECTVSCTQSHPTITTHPAENRLPKPRRNLVPVSSHSPGLPGNHVRVHVHVCTVDT